MITRLEAHVRSGALGAAPGSPERDDLGVRAAEGRVESFADHFAVPHQHASDDRIRMDPPPPGTRDRTGALEVKDVHLREGCGLAHGRLGILVACNR
jgi:hypothetical protein